MRGGGDTSLEGMMEVKVSKEDMLPLNGKGSWEDG